MFNKMVTPTGGGDSGAVSCLADLSQEIGSITSYNSQFTASENCVMIGTCQGTNGVNAHLYINDLSTLFLQTSSPITLTIGSGSYGMVIPKGTTLLTRADYSDAKYNLHFYKMA